MERDTFKISFQEFSIICRVCLNSNNLLPIIPFKMWNMFSTLINSKFNEQDDFPKQICKQCITRLEEIAEFTEKCKKSHLILTDILNIQKDKIKVEQNELSCYSDNGLSYQNDIPLDQAEKRMENKKKLLSSETKLVKDSERFKSKDDRSLSIYQCANCDKNFTTKHELILHVKVHSRKRQLYCVDCNVKFKYTQSLKRHRMMHACSKPFKCNVCGKGFKTTYSRNKHIIIHGRVKIQSPSISKYSCSLCDRILTSRSALNSHMKTHTGEKPYSCSYCGKRFPYLSSLTVHTRLHTDETPFVCPFCNKGYHSSTSLKKHKEVKHFDIKSIKWGSENEENKKIKVSEADKRQCKVCKKILHKHGFGTHMRIHTVEKKKFICTFCNKHFQKNSHLERHIRIHTGERPYECKLCVKTFKQDGDLKRHILTHTGEKQYQCQHCGKQYYTKGSLNMHMIGPSGAKRHGENYECPICKKSFKQCYFKTHMNSHTGEKPFLCAICGKFFTASGTLKVHMRIHTGETPFVCSYCKKGYNNSSSLKRHVMRNHTGEKPHVCMVCHKGFHDSTNLKRHVNRVHLAVTDSLVKRSKEEFEAKNVHTGDF